MDFLLWLLLIGLAFGGLYVLTRVIMARKFPKSTP